MNVFIVLADNIALGKRATQNGTLQDDEDKYGAGNAVDGNFNPDTVKRSCSSTKPNSMAWWTVEFGNTSIIGGLKIYNTLHHPSR